MYTVIEGDICSVAMSGDRHEGRIALTEITTKQAATLMKLSEGSVRYLCARGEIQGVRRFGRSWAIPYPIRREVRRPGPVPRKGRPVTIRTYCLEGWTDFTK